MNSSSASNHPRDRSQFAQQTQSRDLAFQVSFHSQQFHHLSHIIADLNMQNQGILQQRAVVTAAQKMTVLQIETLKENIASLQVPTDHREPATLAFNRSQMIYQAQRAIAVLSAELANINARDTDLTARSNEVFSRMLEAQKNQAQAHGLAWQFHNMHTTHLREMQQRAQATKPFVQTHIATPATASVAPPPTASSADRQTTTAVAPTHTAHLESECGRAQVTSSQACRSNPLPSGVSSVASKLKDLLNQSQERGYKPTYTPRMLVVRRIIKTDDPVVLDNLGSSLIEELKKQNFFKKCTDEDVASCLVTGLKMKRVGIGLESDFLRLYEQKIEELSTLESAVIQDNRDKKRSKKNNIIKFLIGHNRLDLLPEELDLMVMQDAITRGRRKIKDRHVSADGYGGSRKRKMFYLRPELTKKLKGLLALSQQKGYRPVISEFLQVIRRVASATTTEEVEAETPLLKAQILKLKMMTKKNMHPERLQLLAPALRKVKQYTYTSKESFLQVYQQKIEQLEQLNNKLKDVSSLRESKILDLKARQVQNMIFQLLIAHDRLDLLPDDLYLPKLCLNLFITQQAKSKLERRKLRIRKKRKAADTTS